MLLISVFVALATSVVINAQEVASQPDSPIVIEVLPAPDWPAPWFKVSLTNRSEKEILGYNVVAESFDSGGQMVLSTWLRGVKTGPSGPRPFAPGKTWQGRNVHPGKDKAGNTLRCVLRVDYVAFSDGSSWGEDTLKQADYIQGRLQGARSASNRLRWILETKGPKALEEEVRSAGKKP
jgi:hypothetical protein